MPKTKLSTKAAIEQVLAKADKPLTVDEIAKSAIPLTGLTGATPKQTVYSVLYSENKKGKNGLFTRVKAGTFRLNKVEATRRSKGAEKVTAKVTKVPARAASPASRKRSSARSSVAA